MDLEKRGVSQSFFAVALSRRVVSSAIKVAIMVGTLLFLINHADELGDLKLNAEIILKTILTYLVPYGVSTWSAVKAIRSCKPGGD